MTEIVKKLVPKNTSCQPQSVVEYVIALGTEALHGCATGVRTADPIYSVPLFLVDVMGPWDPGEGKYHRGWKEGDYRARGKKSHS